MTKSYNIPQKLSLSPQTAPARMHALVWYWLPSETAQTAADSPYLEIGLTPDAGTYTLYDIRQFCEIMMRSLGAPWLNLLVVFRSRATDGTITDAEMFSDTVSYYVPAMDDDTSVKQFMDKTSNTAPPVYEHYCDLSGYCFCQVLPDFAGDGNTVYRAYVSFDVEYGSAEEGSAIPLTRTNDGALTLSRSIASLADTVGLTGFGPDDWNEAVLTVYMQYRPSDDPQWRMLGTWIYRPACFRHSVSLWYRDRCNLWRLLWLPCDIYRDYERKEEYASLTGGSRLPYNTVTTATLHLTVAELNNAQLSSLKELVRSYDIRANVLDTPLPPSAVYADGTGDRSRGSTVPASPSIVPHRALIQDQNLEIHDTGRKRNCKISIQISPL